MIIRRKISREEFYINYYKALNFMLRLSKKELAILAAFANTMATLPSDYTSDQINAMTFSSVSRKIIAESLGMSIYNLNNYIKSIKDKGVIINNGEKIFINPKLWVNSNNLDNYNIEISFTLDAK